ncbi:glycosyltransferase [Limosilactobacillus fastidiosus]|uniref:Glycosyltransferase n=1 Tax=Limosilactobacillus fastidiosus TaxID=2759855 RepID=A0ABR6E7S5_9LACO|nr:glycosyltransferase [Limosilactobacillus fastidiosus]MBB1063147.1 glycosyltransferase [Limosilactobacillus fastidiosus]MCD7084915.1 glycosyltransferase [Limosilactobacillus fastidiosus]
MKTSVVISTYNGEKYIKEQLDSIKNQTRKADEVLIFDDRSTDRTVKIVKQFINKNKLINWSIKINSRNKGWRKNFIEGIEQATGDIIFTCDQDDIWRVDKVEIMAKIMEDNPKIEVLSSIYKEFFDNGTTQIGPFSKKCSLEKIELYHNYMLNKLPGCTFAFKSKIIDFCRKYWKEGYPHDAFIWRLGLFSNALYVYTDDLIEWRKHKTSAFATESRELKNKNNKYDWILTAIDMNNTMQRFINNEMVGNTSKENKLLKKTAYYLELRKRLYVSANPVYAIRLLRYWNMYPRYRQYLADWYLVFMKK